MWNTLPCDVTYKKFTDKKEPYFLIPFRKKEVVKLKRKQLQAHEISSGTWMQPQLRRGHASPGGSGYGGPAWLPASHSDLKGLPREIRILPLRLTMVFG